MRVKVRRVKRSASGSLRESFGSRQKGHVQVVLDGDMHKKLLALSRKALLGSDVPLSMLCRAIVADFLLRKRSLSSLRRRRS